MAQETEYRLRKMQFTKKALGGYSCEEVDTYLAYVNDRYTALVRENSDLKKKMAAMAAGQNEFREDALREKEKIAEEADAIVREKQAAADRLMEDAKRQAARLLADAEAAAARILQNAENDRQNEHTEAIRDSERKLAERNNAADRLVEEIDSFREQVFAMYAEHIASLERLSRMTDAFYQTKEGLTDDAAVDADIENTAIEDAVDVSYDDTEDTYAPMEDMRIDWQRHKANRIGTAVDADASLEEPMEEAFVEDTSAEPPHETYYDADDVTYEDATADTVEDSDLVTSHDDEHLANKTLWEVAQDAVAQYPKMDEDNTDDDDLLSTLFEGYAPEPKSENEAEDLELAELIRPDKLEDAPSVGGGEEDFLSDIASEYLRPVKDAKKDAPHQDDTLENAPTDEALDDELFGEDGQDISLTGEFDKIFSAKKSADYVNEVSRQPLVEAQKPEKPRKHK